MTKKRTEEGPGPRANPSKEVKTIRISDECGPILFQWPTRLADGLGLKENCPVLMKDCTPEMVPPFAVTATRPVIRLPKDESVIYGILLQ